MSEAYKRSNFSMTTALLAQATFPYVLMIFPTTFSLVALLVNARGPLPYFLGYLCVSLHSPVHSIILLK
ncbi:hypothetical protein PRIPAC_76962, partial [Pristionchus pacificus]|uniref:Uncharacterized protein n=1 Tax=Pristionchus pacificus TaxID=54126 RepID=A0A2A6CPT6_PRIPA